MRSCEGGFEGPQRGSPAGFPLKAGLDAVARNICEEAICQETTLGLLISKHAEINPEETNLFFSVEQSQVGALEFTANGVEEKVGSQAEALDAPGQPTDAHVAEKDLANRVPDNKELGEEREEKAEMGERSKKATFLLDPGVLRDAALTESGAAMGSTPRVSGENELKLVV